MLDRLGPNVWHRTPAEAMATLEELEETARLWLLNDGRIAPLDDVQIRRAAAQFRRGMVKRT
jgi:3-dehydro-4-phosphotetronate decarboxylase